MAMNFAQGIVSHGIRQGLRPHALPAMHMTSPFGHAFASGGGIQRRDVGGPLGSSVASPLGTQMRVPPPGPQMGAPNPPVGTQMGVSPQIRSAGPASSYQGGQSQIPPEVMHAMMARQMGLSAPTGPAGGGIMQANPNQGGGIMQVNPNGGAPPPGSTMQVGPQGNPTMGSGGPWGNIMQQGPQGSPATSTGYNFADPSHSMYYRADGGSVGESGFLKGGTPGRADKVISKAPSGSYIIPADVVAGLGDGNSLSGAKVMDEMLRRLETDAPAGLARGGSMQKGAKPVPVALSHGEYRIAPHHVQMIGHGDMKRGHAILDRWVQMERKRQIDTLKKLKPPVGAKAA